MKRDAAPALLPLLLVLAAIGCQRAKEPAEPAAAAVPAGPATIRIGSWNMAVLGAAKEARPATMEVLARIAAGFDLLAMQEVGSNASTASDAACERAMEAFVARVNAVAGSELFAYLRGDQYAFVYRKDRLEAEAWGLYAGPYAFTYTPLAARFRVEGRPLDFVMLTIHTRPGLAAAEIPALAAAMEEAARAYGEADVVCAGDFNADGDYYEEGPGSTLAGFPPERFITVIPNEADTTVAEESFAYDRMVLSASMKRDYAGIWGILKPGELFDLSACEGGGDSAGSERALSDHYPVWAEFATTADLD